MRRSAESREAEHRRIVAYHEAGHACMAHGLGGVVDVVSIEPTERWQGVCFWTGAELPELDDHDLVQPITLLPLELRRAIETRILITLAGPIGEEISDVRVRRGERQDEQEAVRMACDLTAQQRALLERDDEPPRDPDDDRAAKMAWFLAGDDYVANAFLTFLRAQARSIVYTRSFRRRVDALVEQLLEHGTLGASDTQRILRDADNHTTN